MIQATEVTIVYRGDGKQTAFTFPYPYRTSGDIHGYLVDEMGMETEIVSNYRYDTVENTYIYPVQGNPLTADMSIRLSRETPLQNNVDLPDKLPFSLIEKSMDWIVMMLQETIYRANLAPISAQESAKQAALALTYAYKAADEAKLAEQYKNVAETNADQAKQEAATAASRAAEAAAYSSTAYAASAPAWDVSKTYDYPAVVAYEDGNSYRCIGKSVTGENPQSSPYWVKVTLDGENYFEIDETGGLMPATSPTYSSRWELDSNGDIMPRGVTVPAGGWTGTTVTPIPSNYGKITYNGTMTVE